MAVPVSKVRLERVRQGTTIWRTAAGAGISASLQSLVERRERGVDLDRAGRIAAVLGEPLDALFAEHDGQWWAVLERDLKGHRK